MPPKTRTSSAVVASSTSSVAAPATYTKLQSNLLSWYNQNMRQLPWRNKTVVPDFTLTSQYSKLFKLYEQQSSKDRDVKKDAELLSKLHSKIDSVSPYGIWVSEIMSQQTRIDVVVPFWQRWMLRFPDSKALAEASLEEVQKYWSGLGFYRRCDLLHRGAKALNSDAEYEKLTDKKGHLPTKDVESLKKVPGVGEYTSAAIGSIAFDHPDCPAIDGNVLRVTSRVFGLKNMNVKEKNDILVIGEHSKALIKGVKKTGDFNQAMMELGATICKPNGAPLCDQCPIASFCAAKKMFENKEIADIEGVIPLKSIATEKTAVHAIICVVYSSSNNKNNGDKKKVLIFKRPDGSGEGRRLLSGFWSFPMISVASAPTNPSKVIDEKYLHQLFGGGSKKEEEQNKSKSNSTKIKQGPNVSFNLTNSYDTMKSLFFEAQSKRNKHVKIEMNDLSVRHIFSHIDFTGTVVKVRVDESVMDELITNKSTTEVTTKTTTTKSKTSCVDFAVVELDKLRGHNDHAISNLDEKIVNLVFAGDSGRRRQRE